MHGVVQRRVARAGCSTPPDSWSGLAAGQLRSTVVLGGRWFGAQLRALSGLLALALPLALALATRMALAGAAIATDSESRRCCNCNRLGVAAARSHGRGLWHQCHHVCGRAPHCQLAPSHPSTCCMVHSCVRRVRAARRVSAAAAPCRRGQLQCNISRARP